MPNYTIPPRSKPSDYAKAKLTQDEIIKLQIANDANISKARQAIKMGEPQQLTPAQTMTPDELLADDAAQEATARTNLEKLGFRPQEASDIVFDIRQDDITFFVDFNRNFPAIEADVKKRFNPKLLTPAFFIEYLRQYTQELNQVIGVKVFQPFNGGLNGMINNIDELAAVLPNPADIEYIRNAAENLQLGGEYVIQQLNRLRQMLPTRADLNALRNVDPVRQQRVIDELLEQFREMPSADEIGVLRGMIQGDQIDRRELQRQLQDLTNAIPQGRQQNIVQVDLEGIRGIIREEIGRLPRDRPRGGDDGSSSSVAEPSVRGLSEEQLAYQNRDIQKLIKRLQDGESPKFDFNEKEKELFIRMELRRMGLMNDELTDVLDPTDRGMVEEYQRMRREITDALAVPKFAISQEQLSDLTGTTGERTTFSSSSILDGNFTLKNLVETIKANNLQEDIRAVVAVGNYNVGDKVDYRDLAKTPPANPKRKIYYDDTNIRELLRQKLGSGIPKGAATLIPIMGQGLMNRYRYLGQGVNPAPRPRVIVGKGIAVKESPSYKQYGKYAIHIPQLEQQDILNIKYKSLGQVPKFKPIAVSDIFRDFVLDLLENGKPNQRVYHQIAPQERKVFEEMSIGAGVWNGLGLKRTTTSSDEEEAKRFELLKGEYLAGNNNPKVIGELRRLVVKMMSDGRIRKTQGLELLMELSI